MGCPLVQFRGGDASTIPRARPRVHWRQAASRQALLPLRQGAPGDLHSLGTGVDPTITLHTRIEDGLYVPVRERTKARSPVPPQWFPARSAYARAAPPARPRIRGRHTIRDYQPIRTRVHSQSSCAWRSQVQRGLPPTRQAAQMVRHAREWGMGVAARRQRRWGGGGRQPHAARVHGEGRWAPFHSVLRLGRSRGRRGWRGRCTSGR